MKSDKVNSLQELPRKISWHLVIVFFILSVAIALIGYYFYRDQREHIKIGKQQELSAIADLKVKQIQNWRNERIRDASFIFNNAEIADQIENLQKHPSYPEVKQNKLSWMTAMYKNLQYKNMSIVSNQGKVLVSIPEKPPSISSLIKAHLSEAIQSRKIIFSDLYKDEMQNIFMHIIVPIFIGRNDRKVNIGAVMLWIDPREFLYPLIQSWPTPSATAETLLVGREGDSVVFLNELRHRKNTALTLRFPITENKLPAAMVVRGIKGVVQGTDYRGIEVLAEIRPVPDSPWFLVTKVDMEEDFHSYKVPFRIFLILVFVLIISAGLSISLFWRHQQAQFYRKQHETELQRFALLQKYEYLTRQANDIILILDQEGNIMEANERAAASYGYSQDELLRLNIRNLRSPDTLSSIENQMKQVKEKNGAIFETVHKRKEGATFPVEVSARMISLDGNKFLLSIIRDITERKRAEEALLENEHLLSESQRIAHIGSWSWHVATAAISWSPETYRIYGVSQDIFILSPETFLGLIHPDDRAAMQAWISACLAGEKPEDLEFRIILSDGRVRFINGRGDLQCDAENRPVRMIGTAQDITERKKMEHEQEILQVQLLQAQKMEAIGQLAGGISHDFNNILTAVIGYTHLLKIKMKEDDPLISYPDKIIMLSERAANLTQSLLAFSRKQIMNPRPIDLNEIVRTVEKLLFRIIGEDIRLQTAPFEKDLIVKADHGQIEQVLMNLATNARDAMPGGGLLTIATEPVDIDHEFINEHGFGKEGKYAVMSVIDTGTGMDKETKEKIFEPFFTTKEVGKGTGLGLAMVYGIIRQHEGHINVYSEPGKGTAFRIYLPLIEGKADEGIPEEILTAERGTETILLAEDEAEVRVFVKRLLEDHGYNAIEAIDGQDAIDRFYMHKDKIQFLLLDVIMPKKNGREVYEEIKKINPGIKVLFTSGYPADHINGIIEKGIEFILKPISPIKLLIKIREILDK